MVNLLSENEDDPPQDPHEQERDADSISLSKIPVEDLSDYDDADDFLRDFPLTNHKHKIIQGRNWMIASLIMSYDHPTLIPQ